ncbi:MAG: hypothetical protein A3J76_02680 [Candidatus Moranbacteria bacterium RBG_13_45_13]|nr:MAG: hypothetical protein A3J76_02680 [Candidatus Moranbacteria bacterium RBG_13_45_13]
MNIHDYIEKLRAKPRKEREKIAVIATSVSFAIIFVIWLVSFSEMNKNASEEPSSVPITDQLENMRSSMERDKQSIQDMMQELPQGETEDIDQEAGNDQKETEIPSLP